MNIRPYSSLALSLALPLVILAGCSQPIGGTPATTPVTAPATTPAAVGSGGSNATVQCEYPASGTPAKPVSPPPSEADATGTVSFVMHMDAGDVTLVLDRTNAPCAVNSFESLASQGYFDDTVCHRLAPEFVLQCGDPTATGHGGPGYRYDDELTGSEVYSYATLAMANSGLNTNGSQFFIIIADGVQLPPSYTILGPGDAAGMLGVEDIEAHGWGDPSNLQGSAPKEGGHIKTVDEVNG